MSDKYKDENTRTGAYLEGPRSTANPHTKIRGQGP